MDFSIFFINNFKAFLPEIFLIVITMLLLLYAVIYSTSKKYKYPYLIYNISWLAILSLIFTIILLINNSFDYKVIFNNMLIIDDFSTFIKIILLLSSIISILISLNYIIEEKIKAFEYIILLLLSTIAMLLIISSYDLIAMYLAIEFQSLCFYVLAAFKRNSEYSTEAGLKYFILGAFSSGILLFGISMIYGFVGTTSLEHLAILFINYDNTILTAAVVIGLLFIVIGLYFKIYVAPFHVWAPDVYQGSPTIVAAFFAITPSLAIIAVLSRLFFYVFYDFLPYWQQITLICAALSIFIGTFGALAQNRIKRFIAYSSISHVGYLLLGFTSGTPEGLRSILVYMLIYILMTAGTFTILLSIRRLNDNTKFVYLDDFKALHQTNPALAASFAIILFSMAGIPPLAGFLSKFYIFIPAIQESMHFIVLYAIIMSAIGAVYYLRLIKLMYFVKADELIPINNISVINSYVLSIITLVLLSFFLYPQFILTPSYKIALSLFL